MLEVGRMQGELGFDGKSFLATPAAESRTHFAAWAIVSAPLILGLSLSADDAAAQAALDEVWSTITNAEVIAVSQCFFGVPGTLVRSWQALNVPTLVPAPCPAGDGVAEAAPTDPNVTSWAFTPEGLLRQATTGLCLDAAGVAPYYDPPTWMRLRACDVAQPTQLFSMLPDGQIQARANFSAPFPTKQCLRVEDHWLWGGQTMASLGDCNMNPASYFTENFTLGAGGTIVAASLNGRVHCVGTSVLTGPQSQLWTKPVSADGAMAVLVINGALLPQTVTFSLAEVNITTATAAVRDLFAHEDLPASTGSVTVTVAPHDGAMLLLKPQGAAAR